MRLPLPLRGLGEGFEEGLAMRVPLPYRVPIPAMYDSRLRVYRVSPLRL